MHVSLCSYTVTILTNVAAIVTLSLSVRVYYIKLIIHPVRPIENTIRLLVYNITNMYTINFHTHVHAHTHTHTCTHTHTHTYRHAGTQFLITHTQRRCMHAHTHAPLTEHLLSTFKGIIAAISKIVIIFICLLKE